MTLKSIANTQGAVNFSGTRNFVYTSQSVVTSNDCNGAALPTITTAYHYDCQDTPTNCFGELETKTVTRPDGSSEKTTLTYTNDTTDWCYDRPTETQVQRDLR